jgi:hypothetical protein
MVSKDHRFRVGNISVEGVMPDMSEIVESLRDRNIEDEEPGDRSGVRRISYNKRDNLLFFLYIEEQQRRFTGLDEEGEIITEEMYPLSTAKCVLSGDTLVFESTQGILFDDIVSTIFQAFNVDPTPQLIDEIDRKTMLLFLEESLDTLKKYKVKEVGMHEPNPIDVTDRARRVIEGTSDILDSLSGSVGREGDADDELSEGLVGLSNPDRLRGEDADGRIREFYRSGRALVRYDDEEMTDEEEATLIRRFVYESYYDHISSDDS